MKIGLKTNNDGVNIGETTAEGRGFYKWEGNPTTAKSSSFILEN